jgi:hypothetical protein
VGKDRPWSSGCCFSPLVSLCALQQNIASRVDKHVFYNKQLDPRAGHRAVISAGVSCHSKPRI